MREKTANDTISNKMAAGDPKSDLLWAIGVFVVIGLLWWAGGGPERSQNSSPFLATPFDSGADNNPELRSSARGRVTYGSGAGSIPASLTSPWAGVIRLGSGNARYEKQARFEYLELEHSDERSGPVSITGWSLSNQRQQFQTNPNPEQLNFGTSVRLTIGSGVKFYDPQGSRNLAPIVLNPGDRALVTSGVPIWSSPFPISQSYQVNKCLGYAAELESKEGEFNPQVSTNCPDPEDEPGVAALDNDCYDFVTSLLRCETPDFTEVRGERNTVSGVIGLSGKCKEFLRAHYSYEGCVANHRFDADFYEPIWHVYLGHNRELWAEGNEIVTLYDQNGLIVDQLEL